MPARAVSRFRLIGLVLALFFLGVAVRVLAQAAEPAPQWIWLGAAKADQVVYFHKSFTLAEAPAQEKGAFLVATCDNELVVYLNGKEVARSTAWESPVKMDVSTHLKAGLNTIAVRGRNEGSSPAGLLVRLSIRGEAGKKKGQVFVSDKSWLASEKETAGWNTPEFDAAKQGWVAATRLHAAGEGPWGDVLTGQPGNANRPGTPGTALAAAEVTVLPGFQVELLYSVPRESQGSWVNMCVDPQGRLITSDQKGTLYRVTLDRPTRGEVAIEPIEVYVKEDGKAKGQPLGKAHGLCWAFNSLYVVITDGGGVGNGLYRVRDTNNDDRLDTAELLTLLDGGGEHGPHAIKVGPDGNLWLIAGNHTNLPKGIRPDSPHRNYAEDQLLPRNPDGNGHATGRMAPGGWVARIDPEGKEFTLFCAGFRNEFDIDWNQDGELFTYDSDMEWDTGAPWYRPTRVNHCVSAGEYGWRYGTGKWPEYYADSLGAVANIGLGSPTGVVFGTGLKFPPKYQRALFINDWTYGKIYAVHLQPSGSSYTSEFEVLVQGRPLPVTDIVTHPDGALYFTVGGRGTQSGLYRVTYTGSEATAPVGPVENAEAAAARKLRHDLESLHGKQDPQTLAKAWPHLNSSDRYLRYAARVAVEHQPPASWRAQALGEKRTTAAIAAAVALARTGAADDKTLQRDLLVRLNAIPFKALTEEQKLDLLRAYALTFIRQGKPEAEAAQAVIQSLDAHFPGPNELVNRELCQVLAYLDAPGVVPRTLELAKQSATQQDQMHYIFVLRTRAAGGWTPALRREYFSWLNLAETQYKGGNSFKNFVKQIRKDAVAVLSASERQALADVIDSPAKVEVAGLQTTRQFLHNWQLDDLAPLLDNVATGRSFESGKAAFQAAQCAKCHRFQGDGGATGPDITGVGARFDARYLLEALILPSKVVSDQYQQAVLSTVDGEVITGRIIDESPERYLVRTDPFNVLTREVPKNVVEKKIPSLTSEMPQGLINVLTKEEILDLVAYLRSAGDPNDKAFQP